MFCVRCGKENPEGAVFCAFCGAKQMGVIPEPKPVIEAELVEEAAPDLIEESASVEHAAYRRPDPASQVKPLTDNPAQPRRAARREVREQEEARPQPAPVAKPPAPEQSRRAPARPTGAAVDSSGRAQRPPERKAPVMPPRDKFTARDTIIPRRKRRTADDMFFEDLESPDETPYDDEEEGESVLARHLKSAAAALFLLLVLGAIFWLLVLPGGQVFRASMGMGAPASAYVTLGDQSLAEGSVKRAADFYYDALRLAPDNYDYALKVAKSQAQVGDHDKAMAAYAKCISLKPEQAEPYRAVGELYEQMGKNDLAANAYKTGFDKTGDLELLKKYQALQTPAA